MESPPEKRKPRKKKLEDSILKKSKRFVKDSPAVVSVVSSVPAADEGPPPAKRKKPRHASVEGQRFLKAKERAIAREYSGSSVPLLKKESSTTKTSKNSKKKKKKKGKKKSLSSTSESGTRTKNEETETRYRREALAYLQLWSTHRDHWKFEKLKQVWLLKHALDKDVMDDDTFAKLLEYMASIQGAAKEMTLKENEAVMAQFEGKFGKSSSANSVFANVRPDQVPSEGEQKEYDRAREIVQLLA